MDNYGGDKRKQKRESQKGGVLLAGIRKGIQFKVVEEWVYGLVIREMILDSERRMSVIVAYINEKIKAIEKLRSLVDDLVREGDTAILRGF